MKKLYVILGLTLIAVSGFGQLKVTQSVRYYKDATFDKSPTVPAATGANKALSLQQARDSFFIKRDTVALSGYISGANGQIAKFRGDSAVIGLTNGSEGQVLEIVSGVPAWGSVLQDTIRELGNPPATGNVYVNSSSHRLWVKGGGYWRSPLWAADSISVGSTSKTLVDSYSVSNRDESHALSSTQNDGLGQCFTPSSSGTLESVKLLLYKYGTPTGNAVVKLYAMTGTYGTSGVPTGTALATSDNFDVSTATDSWVEYEITFSGANKYSISASTQYAMQIEWNGGNETDYIEVGTDTTSPTHGGNSYAFDNGYYYPYSDEDNCFSVYANVSN